MKSKTTLGGLAALAVGAFLAWQNGTLDRFVERQLTDMSRQETPARPGEARSAPAPASDADFDYYVLTLSWSPSFCEDDTRNSDQCSGRRPYGFVAHGLWPQYEEGWPEFCDVRARVPERTVETMLPIMPARGLIFHQWKKHGTCSGMQPGAYFDRVQQAYRAVRIPAAFDGLSRTIDVKPSVIEDAFLEVNPALDPTMISISCSKRRLREVRVCFDRNLDFRRCGIDVQRECRDRSIRMPPVRG